MNRAIGAAVLADPPVVAQDEVLVLAQHHEEFRRDDAGGLGAGREVRFGLPPAIEKDGTGLHFDGFAGQADDAFDRVILMAAIQENDQLTPLGFPVMKAQAVQELVRVVILREREDLRQPVTTPRAMATRALRPSWNRQGTQGLELRTSR